MYNVYTDTHFRDWSTKCKGEWILRWVNNVLAWRFNMFVHSVENHIIRHCIINTIFFIWKIDIWNTFNKTALGQPFNLVRKKYSYTRICLQKHMIWWKIMINKYSNVIKLEYASLNRSWKISSQYYYF